MKQNPDRDWHLSDAELAAKTRPEKVSLPDHELRRSLKIGSFAKVQLTVEDGPTERVWVRVDAIRQENGDVVYSGVVDTDLAFPYIWELDCGDRLEFQPRNIFETMWPLEQELPLAAG